MERMRPQPEARLQRRPTVQTGKILSFGFSSCLQSDHPTSRLYSSECDPRLCKPIQSTRIFGAPGSKWRAVRCFGATESQSESLQTFRAPRQPLLTVYRVFCGLTHIWRDACINGRFLPPGHLRSALCQRGGWPCVVCPWWIGSLSV